MNTLQIGTISEGTLRPEDLLPALADELERCIEANPGSRDDSEARAVREARVLARRLDHVEYMTHNDRGGAYESASELIDELQDYLQGFAPPYTYVGAIEGDGSDIGVWVDWDLIEMDERDGGLVRVDETPDECEPDAALVVSDHGNATLYVRTPNADYEPPIDEWQEAWSVV